MELANRDELEAEFALTVARLTAKRRKELEELLGTPPDITRVPEQFWIDAEADLRREMLLMLLLISSASYRQHGGLVAQDTESPEPLLQWALDTANGKSTQWRETSQEWLRKSADDWTSNPDSVTDDVIRDATLKIFGPKRAARIAIDETTRAQHEGGAYAVSTTVGLSSNDTWFTRDDGHVCPICTPLHETKRSYWGRFFPGGPPDPHPGCRCFVVYAHEQQTIGVAP